MFSAADGEGDLTISTNTLQLILSTFMKQVTDCSKRDHTLRIYQLLAAIAVELLAVSNRQYSYYEVYIITHVKKLCQAIDNKTQIDKE